MKNMKPLLFTMCLTACAVKAQTPAILPDSPMTYNRAREMATNCASHELLPKTNIFYRTPQLTKDFISDYVQSNGLTISTNEWRVVQQTNIVNEMIMRTTNRPFSMTQYDGDVIFHKQTNITVELQKIK